MKREVMDMAKDFVAVWAPRDKPGRQAFIDELTELISEIGKAIVEGAQPE